MSSLVVNYNVSDSLSSNDFELPEQFPEMSMKAKRDRKNFITTKLVLAFDRCQLSVRDSVFIVQATIEALGLDTDDFPVNKSTIQRFGTKLR
jgi:hypothetical protein